MTSMLFSIVMFVVVILRRNAACPCSSFAFLLFLHSMIASMMLLSALFHSHSVFPFPIHGNGTNGISALFDLFRFVLSLLRLLSPNITSSSDIPAAAVLSFSPFVPLTIFLFFVFFIHFIIQTFFCNCCHFRQQFPRLLLHLLFRSDANVLHLNSMCFSSFHSLPTNFVNSISSVFLLSDFVVPPLVVAASPPRLPAMPRSAPSRIRAHHPFCTRNVTSVTCYWGETAIGHFARMSADCWMNG